jgi:hypothetical protein
MEVKLKVSIPLVAYLSTEVWVTAEYNEETNKLVVSNQELEANLEAHKYNKHRHYNASPGDWEIDEEATVELVESETPLDKTPEIEVDY